MPRTPHSSPQTLQVFEALLGDLESWRYGYDLSRETGLSSGTLYPVLMRLADQGLLEARWEPSDRLGRPPRHVYRLTAEGSALARQRLAERRTPAADPTRTARLAYGTDGGAVV
ncbi:MAG TPA: PadR family transcriptional regulator [Pilimelia sp.]|nr:PadR family transcriptional regulator [Pilimelia sp.]